MIKSEHHKSYYPTVIVTEVSDDGLSAEKYVFCFMSNGSLIFDRYDRLQKATSRHKFKSVETWARIGRGAMIIKPTVKQEIIDACLQEFYKSVEVLC